MKTTHPRGSDRPFATRGSAMIIVIMLCAFTLILVGTYLKTLSTNSRIGYRSTLQNEGRNAAEGVSEYVLAEMHRRSQANPSFGAGANPNPLSGFTLSTADINFLAPGTGNSRVVAGSIGFKNSVLSDAPSMPQTIDATDPVNSQDPSIDQTPLSIRSLNVFAKAAVLDPQTKTQVKSFVSTNVQIRDQTWFNYAIFYNMDLEFHAGPNFTVYGPVHTNATAYLTEGDGNKLQFFSTLTAVGKLYRYDKYTGNTSGGHGGTVECISKTGMQAADLLSMATNRDSTYAPLFHDFATTRWKSFVQDSTFSVPKFNPPGMKEYVPENYSTGTVELRNNGYLMIEPQLSKVTTHVDPYTGINDYGYKGLDSENLKFSALSGFVIQVKPPTAIGAQPQWQLVCYRATDPSKRISADNPPERDATTGLPIIDCVINPFTDKDDIDYPDSTTHLAVIKRSLKIDLLNAIVSIPYRDAGTSGAVWGNGTSAVTAFIQTPPTGTINPGTPTFTTSLAGTHYPFYDRREGHVYTTASGDSTVPMRGAMHILKIDFAKLNTLLNDASGKWLRPYGSTDYVYNPAARYTGVVYVQFPLAAITTSRFPSPVGSTADGDMIRPAQSPDPSATAKTPGYAVMTVNAIAVPQLATGSDIPDGFTIATNGLLYVHGNFNADGNSATGSSILPDSTSERPALIAADAVTVLSTNSAIQTISTSSPASAGYTEISAAILTGLIPTRPGTDLIWSGGVHNLVRLLESWDDSYRFRGSLGVLYENEVAKGKYHEGHNSFYSPPTRDMGYHQYLSQGRFPPATPIKRTVRRMNLQDITEAQYNAGPSTPPKFN
ncbi:MAG TPA: hypothetical protein VIM71_08915 [Lacunisphaera sp.]